MKEDMLEVLIYLFENYIIDGDSFEPGQEELAKELVSAGFADDEVSKAFVWLEGLLDVCEQDPSNVVWQPQAASSIRFYTTQEAARLKSEGQSLLTRLVNAGLLDQLSRETVIDRVMALDSSDVTFDHIKWVVLMVLSNQPGFAEIAEWAEVVVSEDLLPAIH
ncbi:MAG: Smg protein [Arenicella sp.]|jgi:Smg protein